MTTVLLVDDHPSLRSGVRRSIDADPALRVVAEAATVAEALRLADELEPDVVVLDVDLPDGSGVDVARALQTGPSRVIAFSAYSGQGFVKGLLDAGAAGYVTKDKDESLLVEAIKAVAAGEGRWFIVPHAPDSHISQLTDRERDVLSLLARGLSNADIAVTLFVSESTVRNTLTSVYQKIGVGSCREAISWAWSNGLRPPS
jgi:DNA-binding NarL/FixJ family response regulator